MKSSRPAHAAVRMVLSTGMLFAAMTACAQTGQTATTPAAQAPKPTHTHKHPRRSKKNAKAAPAPPPAPAPVPPLQQAAAPAKINFAQGSLSIDAQNSSLKEILDQVSRQTGLVIQGLDHDERIYGQYGPDTVANTLTDLLDGSGYNYVMTGSGDGAAPTRLVLTPGGGASESGASVPPAASGAAPAADAPAAQPAVNSDPAQPKTPQEIFEELRRQHPQPQ